MLTIKNELIIVPDIVYFSLNDKKLRNWHSKCMMMEAWVIPALCWRTPQCTTLWTSTCTMWRIPMKSFTKVPNHGYWKLVLLQFSKKTAWKTRKRSTFRESEHKKYYRMNDNQTEMFYENYKMYNIREDLSCEACNWDGNLVFPNPTGMVS